MPNRQHDWLNIIPPRYPNGHPEGAPFEHYGPLQSEEAIRYASEVGSDLDLIVIVSDSEQPFETRAREWDVTDLPVPADVLVYTWREWESLQQKRFRQTLADEAMWIYDRN